MNSDYEQRLGAEIDRALKGLADLPAPPSLARRVIAELEKRACLPWYRQAWQSWPAPLRAASLAVLMAAFAALCYGSWQVWQGQSVVAALHKVGAWFSGLSAFWTAWNALLTALILVVKNLGTGFIVGSLVALALGYSMCIGLGTVYVRLGLARR